MLKSGWDTAWRQAGINQEQNNRPVELKVLLISTGWELSRGQKEGFKWKTRFKGSDSDTCLNRSKTTEPSSGTAGFRPEGGDKDPMAAILPVKKTKNIFA